MPVYLICGPPCSGKTTLAQRLATDHDVVLDFDLICAELDGQPGWTHSKLTRERAGALLEQRIARLPRFPGTAYLIRGAPRPEERTALARDLNATVWLLNPGMRKCMRRAYLAHRPARTTQAIRDWYATYRPARVDRTPLRDHGAPLAHLHPPSHTPRQLEDPAPADPQA